MFGKRILLANILHGANLLKLFKRLPLQSKLIVLNYHRIRADEPDFEPAFDAGVYTINASQFVMQINWLKQNVHIFNEAQFLEEAYAPRPSKPGVLITFDDGYRDMYTIAFPILKAFNVPALMFIPTKIIETGRVGWWDMIAYIVKNSPREELEVDTRRFDLTRNRQAAIDYFHDKMKIEKYTKTRHLLDDLYQLFEVDPPDREVQAQELCTWDEIREMAANNIAVGSHAHSHRVLATLEPTAQKEELLLSKLILEQKTAQPIRTLAYPVGGPQHYTYETEMMAKECGYELAFTCDSGVNLLQIEDLYAVRRVSNLLEDVRTVSALVVLPEVFMWDKAAAKHHKVLNEHPDYADFAFRLGLIHLGQGKVEQAITSFKDALHGNPNYVEARIKLAIAQAHQAQYDAAASNLEQVVARHPSYADVHYLLGIVKTARRDVASALDSFRQALQINPHYKDAMIKLGILLCRNQDYQAGIEQLEAAGRLDPDDEELRLAIDVGRNILNNKAHTPQEMQEALNRSLFGGETGEDQTLREFTGHIEISPNLSDMLAIITNHSESDDAIEVLVPLFGEYIKQYPRYADLRNIFGTLYQKLDRPEEAEACFRKAIELSPHYLKAHLNLFYILVRKTDWSAAWEAGQKVAAFQVPYPDFHTAMARVGHALGIKTEALAYLQSALSFNPEYGPAKQLLTEIQADGQSDNRSEPAG